MSDKENVENGEFQKSNRDMEDQIKANEESEEQPQKRISKRSHAGSVGGESTGSYCNQIKVKKVLDMKLFKVNKQRSADLDQNTAEGKYQKDLEEKAKKRVLCTEVCFKQFSDVREFKTNFKVLKIKPKF